MLCQMSRLWLFWKFSELWWCDLINWDPWDLTRERSLNAKWIRRGAKMRSLRRQHVGFLHARSKSAQVPWNLTAESRWESWSCYPWMLQRQLTTMSEHRARYLSKARRRIGDTSSHSQTTISSQNLIRLEVRVTSLTIFDRRDWKLTVLRGSWARPEMSSSCDKERRCLIDFWRL